MEAEFFFREWSLPALLFMLFVFGISLPLLAYLFIDGLTKKSSWSPFFLGFLLLSLGIVIGCASQLFGVAVPGLQRLLEALILPGFVLAFASVPLLLLRSPGRTLAARVGLWVLLALILLFSLGALLRLLDWALSPGAPEGPLTSALGLNAWELPALAALAGLALTIFAYVFARAPVTAVEEDLGEATFRSAFAGSSPAVRRFSQLAAVAACSLLALYCFAYLSDAALGTAFAGFFGPLATAAATLNDLGEALEFYGEWAGFALLIAAGTYYCVSEQEWGCLTGLILGAAAYLGIAWYFGLFEDWFGPFRGAWRALTQWFQ